MVNHDGDLALTSSVMGCDWCLVGCGFPGNPLAQFAPSTNSSTFSAPDPDEPDQTASVRGTDSRNPRITEKSLFDLLLMHTLYQRTIYMAW